MQSRWTAIGFALIINAAILAPLLLGGTRPKTALPEQPITFVDLVAAPPMAAPRRPAPAEHADVLRSIPAPPQARQSRKEAPQPPAAPEQGAPPLPGGLPGPSTPAQPSAPPPTPAQPPLGGVPGPDSGEPDYMPQYEITEVPVVPVDQVLSKIQYPTLAARQGIEATVYVELYIDARGVIRKVAVLKDPGYGFAQAAVKALEGLHTIPAEANGQPVAVRFRYPIRFKLK
jgi:TonB family protein